MLKKKLLLSVTFGALGTATPAMAAPPYNWTGFYIGANAGALWGRSDVTSTAPCTDAYNYFCDATTGLANGAAVGAAGTGTLTGSGFTGGVQAGYNWQSGNTVFGVETDFGTFHFRGSQSVTAPYPVNGPIVSAGGLFTVGTSAEANWLLTLRGRVGWTITPDILGYVTGGLAVTQLQVANSFSDDQGASGGGSNSAIKAGWALGGGFEWTFDKNWSAKIEYLYVDFGSVTVDSIITNQNFGGGYSQAISTSADLTASIARLGINYKF